MVWAVTVLAVMQLLSSVGAQAGEQAVAHNAGMVTLVRKDMLEHIKRVILNSTMQELENIDIEHLDKELNAIKKTTGNIEITDPDEVSIELNEKENVIELTALQVPFDIYSNIKFRGTFFRVSQIVSSTANTF